MKYTLTLKQFESDKIMETISETKTTFSNRKDAVNALNVLVHIFEDFASCKICLRNETQAIIQYLSKDVLVFEIHRR